MRARFGQLCLDLIGLTINAVKTAIGDAKMEKTGISKIVLVGGSTRIPEVEKLLQDIVDGKEVRRSINADKAVVCGAAILATNLTGGVSIMTKGLVLLEVAPLPLGIDKYGDIVATVIKRNTPILTKATKSFIDFSDNVTEMLVSVFEGERVRTRDNHLLGEFWLTGLSPTPGRESVIDMTFEIGENGIRHVSAVQRSTGKQNMITNHSGRLSEKEIGQMLKDTETNKQEDEKERVRMEGKSELVGYVYDTIRKLEKEDVKQETLEANHKAVLAQSEETIRWTDTNREVTKGHLYISLVSFCCSHVHDAESALHLVHFFPFVRFTGKEGNMDMTDVWGDV